MSRRARAWLTSALVLTGLFASSRVLLAQAGRREKNR